MNSNAHAASVNVTRSKGKLGIICRNRRRFDLSNDNTASGNGLAGLCLDDGSAAIYSVAKWGVMVVNGLLIMIR